MNGLIKSPTFEKKFKREFFGGGIPSFLENCYLECEENVRTFLSSFRLVAHNVSGFPPILWPTMWQECEENVSLNEDTYCRQQCGRNVKRILAQIKTLNIAALL